MVTGWLLDGHWVVMWWLQGGNGVVTWVFSGWLRGGYGVDNRCLWGPYGIVIA